MGHDACSALSLEIFRTGRLGCGPLRLECANQQTTKEKKTCNLIMCKCAVPGSTACCIYTATRLRPPAPTHKCCATCRWAHHRIRQNVEVPSSSYITTVVMEDGGKPRDLARLGSARLGTSPPPPPTRPGQCRAAICCDATFTTVRLLGSAR